MWTYEDASLTIAKDDLLRAHTLKQVDNKFIVCRVGSELRETSSDCSSKESALFLIDQHAADERIRVEMLLKDLCIFFLSPEKSTACQRILKPPRPVLLTQTEKSFITNDTWIRSNFLRWGFSIEGPPESSEDLEHTDGFDQVYVSAVPEIVADKVGLKLIIKI